jgi:hypothetical protein
MGVASKVTCVILRLGELISSVIILGILGHFLWVVSDANVYSDARIVYTTVIASISTFLSVLLILPFTYSFLAFPVDFIVAILWLVAFCLLEALTGINTCNAFWYWHYWGFYWGGFWRTPIVVAGPSDIGWSGCSSWKTVLAFSFIQAFLFACSAILGTYVILKYHGEKQHLRNLKKQEVKTSKPPPPNAGNAPIRNGEPSTIPV